MKTISATAVLLLAAAWPGCSLAGTKDAQPTLKTAVLLELFTSEGCSSCPPADRLLQSLDETQPVSGVQLIVLSEHVDYWNSDAWADPYSSPLFSSRQSWYADKFRLGDVYTPQIVIDGSRQTVGSNASEIQKAVSEVVHKPKIALSITNFARSKDHFTFHLASQAAPAGHLAVYVAVAENRAHSKVGGGENGGHLLTHVAVVRTLTSVGTLRGESPFSKDIAVPRPHGGDGASRVVAFVQDEKTGVVVGAVSEKIDQ